MIRFSVILFLFILSLSNARAQRDSLFIPARSYPGPAVDFSVDNLENLYIVFQNGQLKKLGPAGDSIAVFNDMRRFGKLYSFDATNPLKLLLYYKNFGTILILDRFLNLRSTLDLRKQNLFQVKAIGQAYDNNIWVFDEQEARLKRIGEDGRMVSQSTDFRMIFDSMPSPEYIVDQDKQVFLYDPQKGVYIFDYYGTFKSRIPFTGWTDFMVINNTILGRDEKYLYRYEPGTLELKKFPIPDFMKKAAKIKVTTGHAYLMDANGISIFTFR